MRRIPNAALILVALLAACSNSEILAPVPPASKVASSVLLGFNADQPVRISEFHYDNAGDIDVNEWFEISAPAGTSLQGYTIVLYRGSDGMSYGTRFLGSIMSPNCSNGRGVMLHMMPNNTLLNDVAGFALVSPANVVIEFLSYEGSFTAANGPAAGMTSANIGVSEPGTGSLSPVTSLWRNGASAFWSGPSQNTFGTCNDHLEAPPAASVEITPTSASFFVGATQQFSAVAYNASHQPIVNATISWSSSNSAVATVSPLGLVTGLAAGNVTITATAPPGVFASAQVEVKVDNSPPTARLDGPYSGDEGSSISMSGAASTDPDAGDVLTYAWNFGDGNTDTGVDVSHTYAQDGIYQVELTVTDSKGLVSTATKTANIDNVAPSINPFAGATLLPGETYSANGSFTDPGADSWSATVDYDDGSGEVALPLNGKTFTLSRVYNSPGVYNVTVRVTDDDDNSTRTRTVTVLTHGAGVEDALTLLEQLVAAGKISQPNANPIREALEGAIAKLVDGRNDLAVQQLETALKHLDAAVVVGKISAEDALPLKTEILRVLKSVAPSWVVNPATQQLKGKKKGGV
jgi:PKD repeat protein